MGTGRGPAAVQVELHVNHPPTCHGEQGNGRAVDILAHLLLLSRGWGRKRTLPKASSSTKVHAGRAKTGFTPLLWADRAEWAVNGGALSGANIHRDNESATTPRLHDATVIGTCGPISALQRPPAGMRETGEACIKVHCNRTAIPAWEQDVLSTFSRRHAHRALCERPMRVSTADGEGARGADGPKPADASGVERLRCARASCIARRCPQAPSGA